MDRYAVRGLKKLFSLAKTKIRLAEDALTEAAKPSPLPLVKLYSGVEAYTISDCETHIRRLRDSVNYSDDNSAATCALQLCDIIEGVKYRYEPKEYMPLIGAEGFAELEARCRGNHQPLTILLMSQDNQPFSIYLGEEPPHGAVHYSRLISGVAPLLHLLYSSAYFSADIRLSNIKTILGGRTLIGNTVKHALDTLTDQ